MADRILIVVDGYGVAESVGLEKGMTPAQIKVMFTQTRVQRRDLEKEIEKESREALNRARKRIQEVRVFTSKYTRGEDGQIIERTEEAPEWLDVALVRTEVELRLIDLFTDWIEQNRSWVFRIADRPNWLRF